MSNDAVPHGCVRSSKHGIRPLLRPTPAGRSLTVVSLLLSAPVTMLNGSAGRRTRRHSRSQPAQRAPQRARSCRRRSCRSRRADAADRCPTAPCPRGCRCPAASGRTRCRHRRARSTACTTRARCPTARLRVASDSVRPLNHESPSESYWLMLPNAGFGRPRFGDAERRRLRRGQRRHVDVVRHDDAVAAHVASSRPAPTASSRARARPAPPPARLYRFCTSGLMLLIDDQHAGRKRRQHRRPDRRAGLAERQHRGLILRAVALDRVRRRAQRDAIEIEPGAGAIRPSCRRRARRRRQCAATRCWRRARIGCGSHCRS